MSLISSDHRKLSNALQIAIPKKTKGSRKATLLSFTKLPYLEGKKNVLQCIISRNE